MSPIIAVFLEVVLIGLIVARSHQKLKRSKYAPVKGWWWQHFGWCLAVGPLVWLLHWLPVFGQNHAAETYLTSMGVLGFTSMLLGLISSIVLFFAHPTPAPRPPRRPLGKRLQLDRDRILPKPDPALQLVWCDECEQWTPAKLAHQHSLK